MPLTATRLITLAYVHHCIQYPAMILDDHAEAAAALLVIQSEQPGLDKGAGL